MKGSTLRIYLDRAGVGTVKDRLEGMLALRDPDEVAAAKVLLESLPKLGMWKPPPDAVFLVRRRLGDLAEVKRAVALAKVEERTDSAAYLKRLTLGRKMFNKYVGATNPEILGTVWHNLSRDDRHYWVMLADKQIAEEN